MNYKVINIYGIYGETNHRSPEAALDAAAKREGAGWVVVDSAGNQWDRPPGHDEALIVSEAREKKRKSEKE
jgi:hypothetical protein